ncbi:MAG TPA: sulfurtransferase TusC, partial [Atlantibacter hermannii]|nr:sulfurtransferase TusC [Atlantibacter hermannii]
CWICADSLRERGLDSSGTPFVVDAAIVESDALRGKLDEYDVILRF